MTQRWLIGLPKVRGLQPFTNKNVGWKAFQDFVKAFQPDKPDIGCLLQFCIWLRDSRGLATNTINNYRSAVGQILGVVYGMDDKAWEFKAIKNFLFLDKSPNPPRIPSWDLNKVLQLLQSPSYNQNPPDKFRQLKKTLFLIAMATGNRVSEIANTCRTGLINLHPRDTIKLGVVPGFLYKNQHPNRTLPNI